MRKVALLSVLVGVGTAIAAVVAAVGAEPGRAPSPVRERNDLGRRALRHRANTLAALDASTGEVLGVVQIGKRPIGVTSPQGTHKVYTADERSNQLTVVSRTTSRSVKQILMGAFPHHLMASPNGGSASTWRVRSSQGRRRGHDDRHACGRVDGGANPLAVTHACRSRATAMISTPRTRARRRRRSARSRSSTPARRGHLGGADRRPPERGARHAGPQDGLRDRPQREPVEGATCPVTPARARRSASAASPTRCRSRATARRSSSVSARSRRWRSWTPERSPSAT